MTKKSVPYEYRICLNTPQGGTNSKRLSAAFVFKCAWLRGCCDRAGHARWERAYFVFLFYFYFFFNFFVRAGIMSVPVVFAVHGQTLCARARVVCVCTRAVCVSARV